MYHVRSVAGTAIDQWAQNRPNDGPEESERPFDNLGILKVTKTITNSNSDNSDPFETILDYFENFDQYLPTEYLPTDGLYEAEPDDSSITYDDPDLLPPEFRVFETQRRPSALFVPEPSTLFDIESAPLVPTKPTRIIHMINGTPIEAFTKKQSTVETATYGSEFVAARTCVEQIMDLRITLTYLGVPIQGRSWMFEDNDSVVNSSTRPESKLHTKTCCVVFPPCTRSNSI